MSRILITTLLSVLYLNKNVFAVSLDEIFLQENSISNLPTEPRSNVIEITDFGEKIQPRGGSYLDPTDFIRPLRDFCIKTKPCFWNSHCPYGMKCVNYQEDEDHYFDDDDDFDHYRRNFEIFFRGLKNILAI